MSNNYEPGTIQPFFPKKVALNYSDALGDLGVTVTDGVSSDPEMSYLYFDDHVMDIDELVALLQKMIVEAEMDFCTIEAAAYCDKMRPNEFGGWAGFITKDDTQWINTGSWLARRELEFKKSKEEDFMSIGAALQVVYELAEQGTLSQQEARENDLVDEMKSQKLALDVVHDFIVNNHGE